MKYFKLCLLCSLLVSFSFISNFSYAQTKVRTLKGKLVDPDQNPLQGATILIKGTSIGTYSDSDGKFLLSIVEQHNNGILVISFKGYANKEYLIDDKNELEITLSPTSEDLEEVVVVGYGTAKRKDLTGSVVSISATKLEAESPRSVQDLLRGNAGGIIVGQSNSAKADASLLVRGNGTLKAGNAPLHVVDGVIFEGDFTDINPNDIHTIDILKDASATAVYGAKAANGVVIITTKRGATGKPKIAFNLNFGIAEEAGVKEVMNAEEFLTYRYDYQLGRRTKAYHDLYPEIFVRPTNLQNVNTLDWYNYDQRIPVTLVTDEQLLRAWLSRLDLKSPEIDNYLNNKITNWQDLVFNKGLQQDYAASVSNKSENFNYYLSLNHIDREGIIKGNRFKNFRSRINLESIITSFLKVGTNISFANRNEGFLQANWEQSAIISPFASNNIDDVNSLYRRTPNGEPVVINPFFDNLYQDRIDRYNTLNSTMYGIITLPYNFEIQSNFTPSIIWREYYNHESSQNPEWASIKGNTERTFEKTYNWQIDNILRWKKSIGVHNIEVTFLQNAEKGQFWSTQALASRFSPNDALGWHRIQAGTVPKNFSNDTYRTGDALMGRLYYAYNNKYMLTASIRRDGYSAFGAQNPRATFPAIAFAWNFSGENFLKHTSTWLDHGKLRVSWGQNGNRDIDQYQALSNMISNHHPYINQNGSIYLYSQLYADRMANLGLKWESKSSYNIGIDFGLFSNRISGTVDYYNATTNDLLVDRQLPDIIGFNSVATNLGALKNQGIEFTLNGYIIRKEKFNWNSTMIFMLNRRKITKLYGDMINVLDNAGNVIGQREADDIRNRWFIGQDPDRIFDYDRSGVWQLSNEAEAERYGLQPGDFKYIDQNEDGILSDKDRVFQRYRTPRYRWSWRNEFNYKSVNLSFFVYSNWGYSDLFNRAANSSNFPDRSSDYALPHWTPDDSINDYARIGSKNVGNNYVDRSFIRLDNITMSYLVPANFLSKIKIQNLRVSASVRNAAFYAPNWSFGDPESGGIPTPRTYNVNLNFSL